ncbi:MAG: thermostable hemolysin [Gammaproteobacteria bacterium]|jgi:hypothetical protein|nr:thermostable hemolysin [Halieaceae bacterium]MBT6123671.1 thermostable hemolysin [Halieaceae bacterium]MBT7227188.1 thermostable hemolysin [Gammaproteobacteria bacterium]
MMRIAENIATRVPSSLPVIPSLEHSVYGDKDREDVQRYIAGIFQMSYGAQVTEFMPLLVSLREKGHLTSALGLRGASCGRLFCEQYLDEPVETHVQDNFGHQVQRERILEMGNLVASNPGHAALLYTLVGAAMYEAGRDYLLFTANRAVRLSLKRSGLASVPIASADRGRLEATDCDWGSYYNGDPKVMLGDVRVAMESCTVNPLIASVLAFYRDAINELVEIIQLRLK